MLDHQLLSTEFAAVSDTWLNTAHQGPLPASAAQAVYRSAAEKMDPVRMPDDAFLGTAERLRESLARLVHADADEIVIGNSTSYGLHLVANGLRWEAGDEVITVAGDYPSTVLPWRRLVAACGVVHREVGRTAAGLIDVDELASLIGDRTRVVALTWVDSFTGVADDVTAIAEICHRNDVLCVINGSQAVGARDVDVRRLGVDALVSCGFKWLCGPYGTGFAWLCPELRDRLITHKAYWLTNPAGRDLNRMRDHTIRDDLGVRGMDMFAPSSFLNSAAWLASLELFATIGVDEIEAHDQALVARLLDGIDRDRYRTRGPDDADSRSTLVVLDPVEADGSAVQRDLEQAGISTALREGGIRFSPHLFNTAADIDRALEVLHR